MIGYSAYVTTSWLRTLRNYSFVVPQVTLGLHVGDPGVGGTANTAETDLLTGVSFSDPVDNPETFITTMTSTGTPPAWDITASGDGQDITYLSAWNGLDRDTADWLFNARLSVIERVITGDVYRLGGGLTLELPRKAD